MTLDTRAEPVAEIAPPPLVAPPAAVAAEGLTGESLRALVHGQPYNEWPQDLFIPPDALEVFLETFEGPLDLLLYLIRRQNLDILDIPIADITRQYMEYVELMKELRLDLAAEYLVMAALLCEIKSRMLLPRPAAEDEDAEDPRAELVRRLLEYERFQQAALKLDELPRLERDWLQTQIEVPTGYLRRIPPQVELSEVLAALRAVLERADLSAAHRVSQESLSLRERMTLVLERLQGRGFTPFVELFDVTEGRPGVVVTFLAILELIKTAVLELVQAEAFASIHVRARDAAAEVPADSPTDSSDGPNDGMSGQMPGELPAELGAA